MKISFKIYATENQKDYRIEINDILSELEPILFDGEIVNYSEKIRGARKTIKKLTEKSFIKRKFCICAKKKKNS